MKKLMFVGVIGAAMAATQVGAQAPSGTQAAPATSPAPAQTITRAQAKQFADKMFQRFDVNHDGVATRAEADQVRAQTGGKGHMIERTYGSAQSLTVAQFEAATLAEFDAEDANHDGIVTAAEHQQARGHSAANAAAPAQPRQ